MAYAARKNDISSLHVEPATAQSMRDMEIGNAINGDITGRNITVLESGSVDGMVGAENIIIKGIVRGIIEAHSIELLATAHVEGELRYDNLKVAPGAHMSARCIPVAA